MATKQANIVANPSRALIFFEGEELAYNYKTGQWTKVPAYDGYGFFSVDDKDYDVGLVVYSGGSVDFQVQQVTDLQQDATIATGAASLNEGGRTFVQGVRPLVNGGTPSVLVGTQDEISDSTDWSSATSVNSRSGIAPFRKEGRYHRLQVEITDDFNHIIGAEVDFEPAGQI